MPAAWVGAASAIGGALISSSASNDASNTQAASSAAATQLAKDQYDQTRTDNLPALGARNDALTQLETLLGVGKDKTAAGYGSLTGPINPGDVTNDPGYQFGQAQGQRALDNSFNARGMRDSGAARMAAARYGTDYATTKYDDAFNRVLQNRQQQMNPFLSLAGAGQVGTSQIGAAGQNYATSAGANAIAAGDASAQNSLAQGSIYANAGNQLAGWYQNYAKKGTGSNSPAVSYGGYGDTLYGDGYGPQ